MRRPAIAKQSRLMSNGPSSRNYAVCVGSNIAASGAYDPVRSNAALSPFANPTASPYAQKCMKTSCGSLSSR
jgi:hypothetical protein